MKNWANIITLGRIALIPFFMWAALSGGGSWFALGIFVLASLSDMLDGYVARKSGTVSDFGKFIDPLADKLLVASAVFILVERGQLLSWAAMIILAREFAVTSLRMVAMSHGRVIAAGFSGKLKTVTQIVCVCLMLSPFWDLPLLFGVSVNSAAAVTMVLVTIWSGVTYFVKYRQFLTWADKR